jgi:hypothetical protein
MRRIDDEKLRSTLAYSRTFKIVFSGLCSLAIVFSYSIPANAQEFNAGEIVLYNDSGKDVEGRVISQNQFGVLVLKKDWQDHTFHTGGSSMYMAPSALKHKTAIPNAGITNQPVNSSAGNSSRGSSGAAPNTDSTVVPSSAGLAGTGLLSKQEIISYLQAQIGTNGPHPGREEICKQLCKVIKARGVNFKSKDDSEFNRAGADTAVTYTIGECYGPPVTLDWLMGEWDVSYTNAFGYGSRDDGAKLGFVSIEPDGKYLWKLGPNDPPPKWINKTWRFATPAEMKYQGGVGIVLQNGEEGKDWIVHKDNNANPNQDWINIADVDYRQTRRGGQRVAN